MRFREIALCVVLALIGCKPDAKPGADPTTAALADQTTRQLIAGLNAKNATVLANLIVLTSTTGGPPRALRPDELARLVYPDGPFEYQGAGKPGTMVLTDGAKMKRVVRLIRLGETVRALATNEPYTTYAARELGATPTGVAIETRVISIFTRE